jgi:hypothetical protein
VTEGHYELEAPASSKSKLAFEWHIEGPNGVRDEVVSLFCDGATRRGVPAPDCARRTQVSTAELDSLAVAAAKEKAGLVRKKIGDEKADVTCRYDLFK